MNQANSLQLESYRLAAERGRNALEEKNEFEINNIKMNLQNEINKNEEIYLQTIEKEMIIINEKNLIELEETKKSLNDRHLESINKIKQENDANLNNLMRMQKEICKQFEIIKLDMIDNHFTEIQEIKTKVNEDIKNSKDKYFLEISDINSKADEKIFSIQEIYKSEIIDIKKKNEEEKKIYIDRIHKEIEFEKNNKETEFEKIKNEKENVIRKIHENHAAEIKKIKIDIEKENDLEKEEMKDKLIIIINADVENNRKKLENDKISYEARHAIFTENLHNDHSKELHALSISYLEEKHEIQVKEN